MSEEEKAIERCNELIKPEHSNWIGISNQVAIETVLNLIDKQNKVIDEIYNAFYEFVNRCPGSGMKLLKENGFDIEKCDKCVNEDDNINCKECIKQYFIRKVEENDNRTS